MGPFGNTPPQALKSYLRPWGGAKFSLQAKFLGLPPQALKHKHGPANSNSLINSIEFAHAQISQTNKNWNYSHYCYRQQQHYGGQIWNENGKRRKAQGRQHGK